MCDELAGKRSLQLAVAFTDGAMAVILPINNISLLSC